MPCVFCGEPKTCDAHIIPGAIGRDIIETSEDRNTLSLAAKTRIHDNIQSGFFDREILCADCDRKLGGYDGHATEVLRLLGTEHERITRDDFCIFRERGIDHRSLALFAAAVVWRAAISNHRELAQFVLDRGDVDRFRAMVFRETETLPDVAIFRLVSENGVAHEAARAALSYPNKFTAEGGFPRVKFFVRGLLFFVKLGESADPCIHDNAVTTFGAAQGDKCLFGRLFSFDGLLKIDDVENSKYIQKVLASRPQFS